MVNNIALAAALKELRERGYIAKALSLGVRPETVAKSRYARGSLVLEELRGHVTYTRAEYQRAWPRKARRSPQSLRLDCGPVVVGGQVYGLPPDVIREEARAVLEECGLEVVDRGERLEVLP
jgi:hypothetical protein